MSAQDASNHIYYQSNLYCPITSTEAILAEFQETRQFPIIRDVSKYQIAVSRLDVPASGIPLFVFQEGAYVVSLNDLAGIEAQVAVTNSQPAGVPKDYIFSIQGFINDINQAFREAFNFFDPGRRAVLLGPPVLIRDSVTGICSLLVPLPYATGYPVTPTTSVCEIWMNQALYSKFYGFNVQYGDQYNSLDFHDYRFIVQDTGNNQVTYQLTGTPAPIAYLRLDQDSPTNSISALASIIVTSNTIPVVGDQLSVSLGPGTPPSQLQTLGRSAALPIIAEFFPDPDSYTTPLSTISFVYNAQLYRMYDLVGNSMIQTIDYKIYWSDQEGRLYPLYVIPGAFVNIKLLFAKKGLFN